MMNEQFPPPPGGYMEAETGEPRPKKPLSERLVAGALAALPLLFIAGIVGVVVWALASPETTKDYSTPAPSVAPVDPAVQEQAQAAADAIAEAALQGQDASRAVGAQLAQATGCSVGAAAASAPSPRAAGEMIEGATQALKEQAPAGEPVIASTVKRTGEARGVVAAIVGVSCE